MTPRARCLVAALCGGLAGYATVLSAQQSPVQRALTESERERHNSSQQFSELNTQLGRLADLLGRESREIRGMAETQEELKNVLKTLASAPNSSARLSDELRGELRLLSRTIAAAVDSKREVN